ncbi:MAG: hypothetical protein Rpha_1249 [Candidatus Ruthia sp. Apha_13_S6]|nr:hypothetical protein [Candidatus Ruthia sp. Apha_13_S6]
MPFLLSPGCFCLLSLVKVIIPPIARVRPAIPAADKRSVLIDEACDTRFSAIPPAFLTAALLVDVKVNTSIPTAVCIFLFTIC